MKIVHLVYFKFKAETTAEQIEQVYGKLQTAQDVIPGILSFKRITNNCPETFPEGGKFVGCMFTHGFEMIFESEEARNFFLHTPLREPIRKFCRQFQDNVCVFDYDMQ